MCGFLHGSIISRAEGGNLCTVLRKDVGAKGRWQKNHEVGNLHTRFRSPLSPVADLIAQQSIGTMGGSKSGSIVQVRVPEFKSVNFRVVKKRRCVVGIMGGDDKQDELREVLEKT